MSTDPGIKAIADLIRVKRQQIQQANTAPKNPIEKANPLPALKITTIDREAELEQEALKKAQQEQARRVRVFANAGWSERVKMDLAIHDSKPFVWPGKALDRVLKVLVNSGIALIVGTTGTGKTLLAAVAAREMCLGHGRTCKYARLDDYVAHLRHRMYEKKEPQGAVLESEAKSYRVLVLDEFDKRRCTPEENKLVDAVFWHRHAQMSATVLIANEPEEQIAAMVDPSIIDRWAENKAVVGFAHASYRRNQGGTQC
jgi:DNA replication protein DnaC